jgi:Tfp pilus tip-associated adhesin PilY1
MRTLRLWISLMSLANCALPAALALETVHYARDGRLLSVEYRWAAQGLQARLTNSAVLWTFDPLSREFQRGTVSAEDAGTSCRADGLPSDVAPFGILRLDRNGDARIDAATGDSTRLYFGASLQAEPLYFALDVSDPFAPGVLWVDTERQLPGLGRTSTAPTFARIDIGPGQNADQEKFVLLLGTGMTGSSAPARRLYVVDARSGKPLWSAGNGGSASLHLANMQAGIQGGIAAVDLDSDGFAERLYAGDDAGRLWRFDLRNRSEATALASGGPLAHVTGPLHGTPDIALVQRSGTQPYLNISIATSTTGSPVKVLGGAGWLYAIPDLRPFEQLSQTQFDQLQPIGSADLALIGGDSTPNGNGWRMPLAPGEWLTEPTLTVDGRLLFTTFREMAATSSCQRHGENRVYVLSIDDANATIDLDANGKIDKLDRWLTLAQTDVVHGVETIRRQPDSTRPPEALCRAGTQLLAACRRSVATRRSYWYRGDAD